MADVSLEQIVHSAWESAGISAPFRDVDHVLRLINGEGKLATACNVFFFNKNSRIAPCALYMHTATWTRPTMKNVDLARIVIATQMKGACVRNTLWNLVTKAYGVEGVGTNK